MSIVQIILIALIGAMASILLKQTNPEISMIIGIVTGIIILYFTVYKAVAVIDAINEAAKAFNINSEYIGIIIKIIGITYLSEFVVSALCDAGESGIASKVEVFSKIIIVSMAIPVFMSLIQTVSSILL